jgi:3-oxoacyl-[acyl-carrier protein] reductase
VVINGRDAPRLEAAERALLDEGLAVTAVSGSMHDESVVARLVSTAIDEFGRIDLLVNTIGGTPYRGPFDVMTEVDLVDTVRLNTWPAIALIQEALRHGLADAGGAVVNISSGSPRKTTSSMVAYAAAKASLNTLTRTIAADLAPKGVRVNAVSPGLTVTTATRDSWAQDGGSAAGARLPVGRLTEAHDIAAAVAFLLSDDARQITGIVLDVDGGNHLGGGGWSPMG